jgi:hypothetical protein
VSIVVRTGRARLNEQSKVTVKCLSSSLSDTPSLHTGMLCKALMFILFHAAFLDSALSYIVFKPKERDSGVPHHSFVNPYRSRCTDRWSSDNSAMITRFLNAEL